MNDSRYVIGACAAIGLLLFLRAVRRGSPPRGEGRFRKVRFGPVRLGVGIGPVTLATASLGFAAGLSLGVGVMHTLGYQVTPMRPYSGVGRGIGERPPGLPMAGWLNGQPPNWGQLRGDVVVVDIWADW